MPTTDELLNLEGIGQRSSTFRFDVLDQGLSLIGSVMPDQSSSPTVSHDSGRTIMRTLDGLLLPPGTWEDLNLASDRIRPTMVLENGASFALGVFLFGDVPKARSTEGRTLTASLVDQTLILDQGVDRTVSVAPFTPIVDAIESLLVGSPLIAWTIAASGVTTGAAWLTWPVGTSLYKILTELAQMAALYSPYFDRDGALQFQPVPDLATAIPTVTYATGRNIFTGTIAESDDLLTAPNRYIVTDTSATDNPVSGVWDVPADAPNSFVHRGFHVTRVENMQGLVDNAAAAAAAMALGQQDRSALSHVEFAGPPDPRHDANDVISYLIGDSTTDGKYREFAWSMRLIEGGDMRHSLRRVYGVAA